MKITLAFFIALSIICLEVKTKPYSRPSMAVLMEE
jgi:hypothetical protein